MLETLDVRCTVGGESYIYLAISPDGWIDHSHHVLQCSGSYMFLYFYRNNLIRLLCWNFFLSLSVFLTVSNSTTEDESSFLPTNLTTNYFAFGSTLSVNYIKRKRWESRAQKTKRMHEKYVQYLDPNLWYTFGTVQILFVYYIDHCPRTQAGDSWAFPSTAMAIGSASCISSRRLFLPSSRTHRPGNDGKRYCSHWQMQRPQTTKWEKVEPS